MACSNTFIVKNGNITFNTSFVEDLDDKYYDSILKSGSSNIVCNSKFNANIIKLPDTITSIVFIKDYDGRNKII